MSSPATLSKSKRKDDSSCTFVAYDDTCVSLNLPPHLTCRICDSKSCVLSKKRKQQKNNFRKTSKRYRCEQRWKEEHVSIINASQNRLQSHYDTCIQVGMSPKVKHINGIYMHEDAFNPPDVSASENVEYSIIDLADEGEIKIKLKKLNMLNQGNIQ